MKILYAPWRKKYTQQARTDEKQVCPFCTQYASNEDEKHYIIKRYKYNVLMLNLYPYNAGHVMVIPNKHTAQLHDLEQEALAEMMSIAAQAAQILQEKLGAQGVNIGMNLGKAAGAGIPDHLHLHVLPRWQGDTNFMPLLADTKQISFDLNEMYQKLKQWF